MTYVGKATEITEFFNPAQRQLDSTTQDTITHMSQSSATL
jgi:hypothetical protein